MNITNSRTRATLVFFLSIAALWYRAPDRFAHGFLWAEDAAVFMLDAHVLGKHSLLHTYAGYLHLLPRFIAYGQFMLTPVLWAPYVLFAACLFLTAATGAYIAAAIRFPVLAIFMGLSLVLAPQNGEVFLSITNLQWIMFPLLLVLLWQCLFDPPHRLWPHALVTVVLGLTGPFGVLVWGAVFVVAAWRIHSLSRGQVVWIVAFTAAVALQALMMHRYPAPLHAPDRPVDWLHRVPKELLTDLLPGDAPLWMAIPLALWLAVVIAGSDTALIGAFICIVGIAIWALGAYRTDYYTPIFSWHGTGSRYLYVPILMFWWASVLACATARSRTVACAAGAFAVLVALASASHFEFQVWRPWSISAKQDEYEVRVPPDWNVMIPRQAAAPR